MGESDDDLVEVAFALADLAPDSVPVNFLIPFDGTPMAGRWQLTPQRCLQILAMVRFVFPDVEVRLAGGREIHLRTLQPLALHIANAIFLGDYLTSEGQAGHVDLDMISDAGFVVEAAGEPSLPSQRAAAGMPVTTAGDMIPARTNLVRLRRRGAGTELPPNLIPLGPLYLVPHSRYRIAVQDSPDGRTGRASKLSQRAVADRVFVHGVREPGQFLRVVGTR